MTLPYEIAKKLKEAGFPQKNFPVKFVCVCDRNDGLHPADGRCSAYLVPLEELIEACEEKGQLLLSCYGKGVYLTRVGYFVESTPEQEAAGYPQMAAHIKVEAPTLVEAVANLWLALHTK